MFRVIARPAFWVPLAAVVALAALVYRLGWWQQFSVQVVLWQGKLYRELVEAMTALHQAPTLTTWGVLLGVSFGYGVFHAAGPGHGKVVLSTYLASQGGAWRRALGLSVLASLLQGVMAIAIISVLVFGLGWLTRQAMGSIDQAELVSFVVVSLVGLWLCVRSLRRLYVLERLPQASSASTEGQGSAAVPFTANAGSTLTPMARSTAAASISFSPSPVRPLAPSRAETPHHAHGTGCGCGHDHHIDPHTASDWRVALITVLSIGIRPCSGAVLLLGAAALLDQFGKGVVAVLAMSLGTSLTVSSLALLSVFARDWVKRHLKPAKRPHVWQGWIGLLGGTLILAFGLSLTAAQWQQGGSSAPPMLGTPPSPSAKSGGLGPLGG
ncbi:nickel/cobalt transporter [Salinicola rhizosphaerae]|uniref:Nickel/cobalt efflux system n=1 Tax=Salinicola rhizosphaerae TaxID=1443141 RepID=A0ABQ3EET3_9GAMM|nr:sodium:proton antiporter [Salinicola rhizosphaerae]GHB32456.1 nickel/cobalt efflux system [Salinicola rhizosphaerae]